MSHARDLTINPVIYAEISARFSSQARLDAAIENLGLSVLGISREAAFLAAKAFAQYRTRGGSKGSILPHFFIGAHASALNCDLLTRDTKKYAAYFPGVRLIAP